MPFRSADRAQPRGAMTALLRRPQKMNAASAISTSVQAKHAGFAFGQVQCDGDELVDQDAQRGQ